MALWIAEDALGGFSPAAARESGGRSHVMIRKHGLRGLVVALLVAGAGIAAALAVQAESTGAQERTDAAR